ncbi:hypothetical protein D3C76_1563250 [compost metagenome]
MARFWRPSRATLSMLATKLGSGRCLHQILGSLNVGQGCFLSVLEMTYLKVLVSQKNPNLNFLANTVVLSGQ